MSPVDSKVYLVTGANRGIGLQVVKHLLAKYKDAVVFLGVRDIDKVSATVAELRGKYGEKRVESVKIISADKESNKKAAEEIKNKVGRLDVIIANAGIAKHLGRVLDTPTEEYKDHWEVNTLGFVILFQAVGPLLLESPTKAPVLVYISSIAGSIGCYGTGSASAYSSSKAAGNLLVKAIDDEHKHLICMAIHPGWVQTDMGNFGATANGMKEAPDTVEESADGIISRIDGATKEKNSGKFFTFAVKSGKPWDQGKDEIIW